MYARITTTQFSPYRLDEAISVARENALPAARQQCGFKGYLMLVDRSSGKGITITLWEDENDRAGTSPESAYYREAIGQIVPFLTDAPLVEDLELVIQE
jgi:hypothetical protein